MSKYSATATGNYVERLPAKIMELAHLFESPILSCNVTQHVTDPYQEIEIFLENGTTILVRQSI